MTAQNVVDVSLRAAYERFPVQPERVQFLGELSRTVFEAFTRTELDSPSAIVASLGQAIRTNHLFVHLTRPDEQGLVTRVGADGGVPPVQGDSLLVVNQNVSANKVDLYLHRRVRYSVTLDPSSELASLKGRLEVTLDNRAPADGLPQGVIGPYDERFAPGENRTYVSLATPFGGRSATIDGEQLPLESHTELGRLSNSATVSIPPLEARTIRMELEGLVQLDRGGWYRLDLGHQPLVVPDEVDVAISVPKGWRIAETRGLSRRGARHAEARLRLEGERSLLVRVERAGWSAFWHRLIAG